MYVVGIDAAKGKSTVCVINEYGEVLLPPRDIEHTSKDLDDLLKILKKTGRKEDMKVVMEATGIYHWPVLNYFRNKGYFVSVINPLKMKMFSRNYNFRGIKTDKIDSKMIALYGISNYHLLKESFREEDETRAKLKRLSRSYEAYQKPKISLKQALDVELEKSMPGIKKILYDDERLSDFVAYFYHFGNISKMSEKRFLERFDNWAKKRGYRFHSSTPARIYELSRSAIPSVSSDDVSRLAVSSIISSLSAINGSLKNIISAMDDLAKTLPEYEVVMAMPGVGKTLGPLLMAEIGDIRYLRNRKSLVSMAGIDVPPYESGQFRASHRSITKKGNSHLRRHLYLVMTSILMKKPGNDTAVYDFMIRKKDERKHYKQVRVAGMRKFLSIYYARVKAKYKELGIWYKDI